MAGTGEDWRALNRANWDERVAIHLRAPMYDVAGLRAGTLRLHALEAAEVGPLEGRRVLHLQCHFGSDSLTLARHGAAEVVGLDFSANAIAAARALAAETGLAERVRFVEADLYDAPAALPEPQAFDLVYVTWGAINWLPDIRRWAEVAAHFVRPGGALYLAEGHPAALVLDDAAPAADGTAGWFVPYFGRDPLVLDDPRDYADESARLRNARTWEWLHPLGEVVSAVIAAGLRLAWLHEHDAVPWRMFRLLVEGPDGRYRWPERPWLPLAYSLRAERPITPAGRPRRR